MNSRQLHHFQWVLNVCVAFVVSLVAFLQLNIWQGSQGQPYRSAMPSWERGRVQELARSMSCDKAGAHRNRQNQAQGHTPDSCLELLALPGSISVQKWRKTTNGMSKHSPCQPLASGDPVGSQCCPSPDEGGLELSEVKSGPGVPS